MALRRWFQFRLKSLMAFVVVICIGLGGWHLLMTYGQWVEAEPAVVGQPIKIRGRFFHLGRPGTVYCGISISGNDHVIETGAHAEYAGFCRCTIDCDLDMLLRDPFSYKFAVSLLDASEVDLEEYLHKPTKFKSTEFIGPGDYTLKLTPNGGSPIHGTVVVHPAD